MCFNTLFYYSIICFYYCATLLYCKIYEQLCTFYFYIPRSIFLIIFKLENGKSIFDSDCNI